MWKTNCPILEFQLEHLLYVDMKIVNSVDRYFRFNMEKVENHEVLTISYFNGNILPCMKRAVDASEHLREYLVQIMTDQVCDQVERNWTLANEYLFSWAISKGKTFVFRRLPKEEIDMVVLKEYIDSYAIVKSLIKTKGFNSHLDKLYSRGGKFYY